MERKSAKRMKATDHEPDLLRFARLFVLSSFGGCDRPDGRRTLAP